jgi:hypothetical protein
MRRTQYVAGMRGVKFVYKILVKKYVSKIYEKVLVKKILY